MRTGPLSYPAEQAELLQDPYLQAFIGAKSVEAAERGVALRVGPETLIRGRITDPQDVTTVLGNLIDNAVRAAVHGSNPDRWAEVEVMDELSAGGGTLHVVVADSGDGLADANDDGGAAAERIFAEGYSTAKGTPESLADGGGPATVLPDTHGQGFGLPLIRRLARRRGGDVWVADAGRDGGPGAVFCARLPGTVEPQGTGEAP
jgi:two-component system, CitB family, sensor kinase